ncbi:MAG: metallophosphoesterase [Vicinamibacterales bacterium]
MADDERRDGVRIAAVGDIHFSKHVSGPGTQVFSQMARDADVLLLLGDLTDTGLPEEAQGLARTLTQSVAIPIVAVLGNHDFESGREDEVRSILVDAGITVLDGEAHEVQGIGFAGVKGFAGGFGRGTLGPWGERVIKAYVQEAVSEALKLESALARLRTPHRIALLHYSPIAATVEGEPREIFPFLGCSRLEEPLNRYPVTAVFHGHAHNGVLEGATSGGVAVYNVSLPLLQRLQPDAPFRVLTLR